MSFNVASPILCGKHVRLEPVSMEHARGLFDAGKDLSIWTYLPISGFNTIEDADGWVESAIELRERNVHFTYVQIEQDHGTVVGSTRYMNVRARDHGLEIGYTWLSPSYQRSAINSEAKFLLLCHAFEVLGAYRVELKTDRRNEKSQRAILRIGAKKEGVLRKHMVAQHGFIRDTVLFSIIDSEWPVVKKDLQCKLDAGV